MLSYPASKGFYLHAVSILQSVRDGCSSERLPRYRSQVDEMNRASEIEPKRDSANLPNQLQMVTRQSNLLLALKIVGSERSTARNG